ncbi:MAG TPA: glycosyltransferase family 2 protein [Chloroflexi bacterium]|nr:glycosyltransferase family 2 protein [Chloroflexota bacterium]HHW87555.1 glycosyltransferase family 2 protein [Chloroflexota bacterium]
MTTAQCVAMPNPPAVWCIVLAYNGIELTLECLRTLRAQDYANMHILVVDNASTDGTPAILRTQAPDVEVLEAGGNLGYAGGNNLGMRHALAHDADLLFLVNNDTRLDPHCVTALVEEIQRAPTCGVAGPMVYTWDNWQTISSAGGHVDWAAADAINVGAGETDQGQYPARSVDFVNGCGIMVTRQAIERAGLIDERFFMYWEETDWCLRIHAAGLDVRFQPAAKMQHKAPLTWEQQSPITLYYMGRNRLFFFARHGHGVQRVRVLAGATCGLIHGIVQNRRNGNRPASVAAQHALIDGLCLRWGRRPLVFS